ncbi:ATP-binding protein [Nocardia sp. alder85J]|uniref:ATP-binding protein n=1 Tax=Nocardia sp. alder85J TaxID=2862949 RepID=UPI001CD2B7F4|nr:ATP-binding protein [Nocardia sp. alder85J]MCX4095269.1 sensor histidine kinase [Nocardia sp. alder85J]
MNESLALTISWILAVVLLIVVVATVFYAYRQRTRSENAEDALRAAEQQIEHLRMLHNDLRRQAEYEVQQSISRTEVTTRERVEGGAREATAAAVRAFGTAVVSLGTDVGQVVSSALREHRGDDVYETLIRIDHSVQQMIRQAQSYVIVCGGLPGRRWPQQTLTDVVGGAAGRVRDYTRIRPQQLDRVAISRAVEPLVHTLATLLDNALRYSPPASFVDVTFQEGHHGVTIIVDDAGVRMNGEQMEEARQILSGERIVDIQQLGPSPRIGLPGIAALSRRYGFTVYVDGPNMYGGMRAMVYVPEELLVPRSEEVAAPDAPAALAGAPVALPAAESTSKPTVLESDSIESTVHEITPGGLPRRRRRSISVTAPAAAESDRSAADPLAGEQPGADTALPRADIAAAWHSGSHSGRAAAYEHTEGMTS